MSQSESLFQFKTGWTSQAGERGLELNICGIKRIKKEIKAERQKKRKKL